MSRPRGEKTGAAWHSGNVRGREAAYQAWLRYREEPPADFNKANPFNTGMGLRQHQAWINGYLSAFKKRRAGKPASGDPTR